MSSLTIRNIPESIFEKLKFLAGRSRRSLNSEFLIAIERGAFLLESEFPKTQRPISVEMQVALWQELSGKWKDKRTTKAVIRDIYETRTLGRDVVL